MVENHEHPRRHLLKSIALCLSLCILLKCSIRVAFNLVSDTFLNEFFSNFLGEADFLLGLAVDDYTNYNSETDQIRDVYHKPIHSSVRHHFKILMYVYILPHIVMSYSV